MHRIPVILVSLVLLLFSCEDKLTVKHAKTIGPPRGDCFEELILLERAGSHDTLSYLHIPFDDGPATIRLHPKFNIRAGARLVKKNADFLAFQINYSGVEDGVSAPRIMKGGFSEQHPVVGDPAGGDSWNSGNAVMFVRSKDQWKPVKLESEERHVTFLYRAMDEELRPFGPSDRFVLQRVHSGKRESITYATRIERH